ncbi:MAG: LptF/LptG family permease [Candidatus Omnitrophota bacterium]
MRILRNYALKELIGPFLLSLLIFTFILLMGNMIQMADLVITKGVNILDILRLLGWLVPYLLSFTIPMSVLTSVLLAFGRLSQDNEILTMRASGFSLYKIIVPVIIIGLIFSLLSFILNNNFIPQAHYATRRIAKEVGIKNPASVLESGTFIKAFEKYIIFVYKIKGNKLYNIRIYEPQENRPTRTIIAEKGEFVAAEDKQMIKLKLMDGVSDEPNPSDPSSYYKLNFKTYYITLDLSQDFAQQKIQKKPKDMPIKELREELKKLSQLNISTTPIVTEIYKKISISFSCLAFIIISLPLAIKTKKSAKSTGFGISLMIILIYYLLFIGAEAISLRKVIAPELAMWIPNAVLFTIGIILTYFTVEK